MCSAGHSNRDTEGHKPVGGGVRDSDSGRSIDLKVVSQQVSHSAVQGIPRAANFTEWDVAKSLHEHAGSIGESDPQDGGIVKEGERVDVVVLIRLRFPGGTEVVAQRETG